MPQDLKEIDESQDVGLMVGFRQENWDSWCEFCKTRGYHPVVRE